MGPDRPGSKLQGPRLLSPSLGAIVSPEIHSGVKAVHDHDVFLRGRIVWEGVNNQAEMLHLESVCQVVPTPVVHLPRETSDRMCLEL